MHLMIVVAHNITHVTILNMDNLHTYKRSLGVIGALSGVASGFAYEYHQKVMLYQKDDVSNTIGLYLWIISGLCWIIFLILHSLSIKK